MGGGGYVYFFLIHTPFLLEKLYCANNMNEGEKKSIGALINTDR
jgi:hypothetical protein